MKYSVTIRNEASGIMLNEEVEARTVGFERDSLVFKDAYGTVIRAYRHWVRLDRAS